MPAGRDQCTFLWCSISVRAHPTALACKGSMRRCSAMRRPTCFGLGCTCRFHECGGIGQCVLLHSVCTSFVRSKVESLRALHQYTNVQHELALHAAPATLVARPAPVGPLPSWSHGRFEVHERRRLRPLALRCFCNSACDGRVAAHVYMPMQWNTIRAATIAPSRPALVRCAATVEIEVRGPPVPFS